MSLCVYDECVWKRAMVYMWRSEDNLVELVLSFHRQMGSGV